MLKNGFNSSGKLSVIVGTNLLYAGSKITGIIVKSTISSKILIMLNKFASQTIFSFSKSASISKFSTKSKRSKWSLNLDVIKISSMCSKIA